MVTSSKTRPASPLPKRGPPRVNVVVTKEQHALLLELASLDETTSASGFLRELLDQVTPLLRKTVPMMRAAKEAHQEATGELKTAVGAFMQEMAQMDLLDAPSGTDAPEPQRRRSEDGRGKPLPRRKK